MRVRVLWIALSIALLGFAPAPLPKKQRQSENLTDVVGLWQIVVWEGDGSRDQESERTLQVRMTKEQFSFVMKGDRSMMALTIRLEPSASPPAIILGRRGRPMLVGSYRLQKDEMTMILGRGEGLADRPTDFAGKPQIRLVLRRLRRD